MIIRNYKNLVEYLSENTKKANMIIGYIGSDTIIERILEEEGPIVQYIERHGFTHGPHERISEYRDISADSDEILQYVLDRYDDLFNVFDDFLKVIKDNKSWVEKFLEDDSEAIEQYNNGEDPIITSLSSSDKFNDEFVNYICDYLF